MRKYELTAMNCITAGKLALAIAFLRLQIEIDADNAAAVGPGTAWNVCSKCGSPHHHEDNHEESTPPVVPGPADASTQVIQAVHDETRVSHAPTQCAAMVAGALGGLVSRCGELIRWHDNRGFGDTPSGWYHESDRWLGANNHPATPPVLVGPFGDGAADR